MISEGALTKPFYEHRTCRGDLVIVEKALQHAFEVPHPALLYLGVFDGDPDRYIVVFGLHFEDSFWCGEQDIRDDGFGGDGQLVQPSAAESRNGAPPAYEVTGPARAGQVDGYFFAVGRGIHSRRVQRKTVADASRIDSVANPPTRSGRLQEVLAR